MVPAMQPRCQLLSARLPAPRIALSAPARPRTYATALPAPAVKNPLQRRKGGDLGSHLPKHIISQDTYMPAYPYGDHALFKQANRGLYGDQRIQFGNNVSHKSETKTRRHWKPNVLSKSLYSVALKKKIKLRITAKVLKTMDREGGLDEYLLKDNEHRLKELGPLGWALRWTLLQRPEVVDRMRANAATLGLDQATIDAQWPTQQMHAQQKAAGLFVKAADLIPDEYVETAEEHETVDPENGCSTAKPPPSKRPLDRWRTEYTKAAKAAQRYISRGLVDTEEAGFKLAFIRAKERQEAAARLKANFTAKLNQQFSAADLEAVRSKFNLLPSDVSEDKVRRIAYNQWRRAQIDLAGSYDAWRTNIDAEKALQRAARVDEAGGHEAYHAGKKVEYANMIDEAETAASNEALDHAEKERLERAMRRAELAVKAGGPDKYAEFLTTPSSDAVESRPNA